MSSSTTRLSAVSGDVAAAYAGAFTALAEAGLGPSDVVYVVEYATGTALNGYAEVETARTAALDGQLVPVATVGVEALPEAGAVLAVELTAFPGGGTLIEAHPDSGFHRGTVRIADDIVYLPSVHPHDGTAIVHADDFREQYRYTLEKTGELLKAAGLGLDALVQTTDYTARATRSQYPRCGRPRKELLGGTGSDGRPIHPGAAGIVIDQAVVPGAMVSLDAIATTVPFQAVNPGWKRYATLTYKPGLSNGRTLFMSGFGSLEPATQKAIFEDDLLAQAEYTYASIATVLREAGLGEDLPYGSVTRLVEYITPDAVPRYPEVAEIRRKYFGDTPALTSVVCSALLRPEFLIEVVPTAVFPGGEA
ncbi:enamine deaminase RidA (YjgF/YER057c/UK114 family) [Actinocorallia herbida]|uniref:Enamine deaminase RidA (YjgF/YER057c/UK114 family) n=1 Tax=Actinocorallia herbida TaxID=58109 RepID=A0A3N1D0H0_9ACTN|nr:RidA family protein [Actinocorallia herbida]ROO86538.1 enamine deaminase RidA (YjgF/YER057c/UK114 family) [Actinocorallia herbida]